MYRSLLAKTISAAALAVFVMAGCVSTRAATETFSDTLTPSGSDDNVTNGDQLTVFSDDVSFEQFNPSLGTLDSATLSWGATGSLTVGGNMEGQAIMSFITSDTETWNIFGGTTTVGFSINGSEGLSLAGLTGTGGVSEGDFAETFQLQGGYFIPTVTYQTGASSGTFTITYNYTPAGAPPPPPPPPPPSVPEMSSVSYLFTSVSFIGLFLFARRRSLLTRAR